MYMDYYLIPKDPCEGSKGKRIEVDSLKKLGSLLAGEAKLFCEKSFKIA